MIANLFTKSELAPALGIPLHTFEYLVRTRSIEPTDRVGNVRLYDRNAIEQIATQLDAERQVNIDAILDLARTAGAQACPE